MYKTILYATDLSENHYNLCQKAVNFATCMHAKLHFIHVIEIPASLLVAQNLGFTELAKPSTEGADVVMSTLSEAFAIPLAHFHVEVGTAYTHILSCAKALSAQLIIMGSHADTHFSLMGSTTQAVIHHADSDVLILKC